MPCWKFLDAFDVTDQRLDLGCKEKLFAIGAFTVIQRLDANVIACHEDFTFVLNGKGKHAVEKLDTFGTHLAI